MMDSPKQCHWKVTVNRRRRRCPGICGGDGPSGKPGFKHECSHCQMWMCPACRKAHVCVGNLPDFGVDKAPHDPPRYKAQHDAKMQHRGFDRHKFIDYSHNYIAEHHHIKPTSTVVSKMMLRDETILQPEKCLFADEKLQGVGKVCHRPPPWQRLCSDIVNDIVKDDEDANGAAECYQ